MIYSEREWLRFVTLALVAGGTLGAANTGAFLINGLPLAHAVTIAATFTAAIALVVHGIARVLLDREPTTHSTDTEPDDTTDS